MGANTKQLRNRIKSVDSTLHLTKAMGLVASSKIRRATDAMQKSREYANAVTNVINSLAICPECAKSPFILQRDGNRQRIIVIAGDRGLAGGYNAGVFRLVRQYPDAEFIPVGKRACDRFAGKKYSAELFSYSDAIALSQTLCRDFENGRYRGLGIIRTKYVSIMTQEPQFGYILPLSREEKTIGRSVLFEPDETTLLHAAITEYVAALLVSAVRESFASEVAARKCAMDAAGKNAQQMIDALQLEYNRARQGAITQELTEIVAGSGS